jgi:formyltetrahydrofolate-dependent phosphoribosylglycinamide formyltransferase
MAAMLKLAVFVGTRGRGSNLRAIYEATGDGRLAAKVVLVVGSQDGAPALMLAREIGLTVAVIDPKSAGDDYGAMLLSALGSAGADAIALAGYLRRLPSGVVAAYRNRILNTHPALLPSFGGKGMYGHHVHEAVLAYGAKVSGCTVHFVDDDYDTGPVILQRAVLVEESDTPEALAARILPVEHLLFVEALQLLATGRVSVSGRRVQVAKNLI